MNEILYKNRNLLDKKVIDYFKNNEINMMYSQKSKMIIGEIEHNPRLEIQIDIIENEIIRILEKKGETRSNEEKEILRYARNYYKGFYNNSITAINCSIFNNNICKLLFSNEEINSISNYKYQTRLKARKIFDKYINNELITEEEEIIMFEFFTSQLGTEHQGVYNCQKQLISKLLSSNNDFHISGKIFYAKFIANEKCKKLNLSTAKVYIGNKDFWNNSNQSLGTSYGYTGLITINESFIRKNPTQKYDMSYQKVISVSQLVRVTQTVHHELEHYKQACYNMAKKINLSSYYYIKTNILRQYLSSDEFNEYKKNYQYKETEREADIAGWRETAEFLKKYAPKKRFKEIEISSYNRTKTFLDKSFGYGVDKNNKPYILDEYNIKALLYCVKRNPKLIETYPLLNLFFNKDGTNKKIFEMIKILTDISLDKNKDREEKRNYKEVYSEILDYAFSSTDLYRQNITSLSYDEQNEYFLLIAEAYERECRELKRMMDVYQSNNSKAFDVLASNRIARIKKYYTYLMDNQDKIEQLSKLSSIFTGGKPRYYNLIIDLESFEDRIDHDNSYLKGTLLEKEIRDLTKLMGEKKYKEIYGASK